MTAGKFVKYHFGSKNMHCHLDAVHAENPRSDMYTGPIAQGVVNKFNISAIISRVSRKEMDLNRDRTKQNAEGIDEYREILNRIISRQKTVDKTGRITKNHLHIALHGMANSRGTEFELGTRHGKTCSKPVLDWIVSHVSQQSKNYGVNKLFQGDKSIARHRLGDPYSDYKGYGPLFHTIQVEINHEWRKYRRIELVNFFGYLLMNFDKQFNKSKN